MFGHRLQRYESAMKLHKKLLEEIEKQCSKYNVATAATQYTIEDLEREIADDEQTRTGQDVCCPISHA